MGNPEKKTNEDVDLGRTHHKIISPQLLFTDNKKDIETFLLSMARKYKVSVGDIATSLSKTFEKYSNEQNT